MLRVQLPQFGNFGLLSISRKDHTPPPRHSILVCILLEKYCTLVFLSFVGSSDERDASASDIISVLILYATSTNVLRIRHLYRTVGIAVHNHMQTPPHGVHPKEISSDK